MRDWYSQFHVRWYCKYHIVFVPKYRRRVIYGQLRRRIGRIIARSCAPLPQYAPQVQRGQHRELAQRQVSDPDSSGVFGTRAEFYRVTFLGARLLCQHGWAR